MCNNNVDLDSAVLQISCVHSDHHNLWGSSHARLPCSLVRIVTDLAKSTQRPCSWFLASELAVGLE